MNVPLTPLRFLRYARAQFPSKTAMVCGQERFTYAEFAERAGRLAGALVEMGANPGDRVAFLSTNCHRLLEAYYGVLEAGCILLPLNIRLAVPELSLVLTDAGVTVLFCEQQFLPLAEALRQAAPSIKRIILLDGQPQSGWLMAKNYESLLAGSTPFERDIMGTDEDSVAELFYTSGTSDRPKGVMLTHRNIYLHALLIIAAGQTSKSIAGHTCCETVHLHTIPLFHANGWGTAHSITMLGGTHVLIHHFSPAEVFRLIERERVWCCALVPTMAAALVNSPERDKYDLSSLRSITIGGAASSPTLVRQVEEKLGCVCISGYGLTETSPVLALSPMKPGVNWEGEQRYAGQAMTGYAIPGVELRAVDAEGNDLPSDNAAIGELVARGDVVMQGYWGNREATEAAMQGGWFHTGDMASVDENNYVLIVDRKKDIIVSGGENISSLEVEKVLAAHPCVYEAVVIPVPDDKWGEVPKAVVATKPGSSVSDTELLDFCRARLSHYKCPRSVEFVESLPKTGTGKLLKRELRKKYWTAQKGVAT